MPRKPKIGPPSLLERVDEHNNFNTDRPFSLVSDGDDNLPPIDDYFRWGLEGIRLRQEFLEYLRQGYAETENPLYPWDARSLARKWKIPVPKWVEKYLDHASEGLLNTKNKPGDVSSFFGFDGNRNTTLFSAYLNWRAKYEAVDIMNDYIRQGVKVGDALGKAVLDIETLWGVEVKEGEVRKLRLRRKK